jgi:hypothetical protein
MDGSILQQGTFIGTGNGVVLNLVSGVDWMNVYNMTEMAATNQDHGFQYYWQRGMASNDGVIYFHPAADETSAVTTSATQGVRGFTLIPDFNAATINGNFPVLGPRVAFTAITTAPTPLLLTGSTAGVTTGSIVLLTNVAGAPQFGGYMFTVGVVTPGVSFELVSAPQLTVASTGGFYQIVTFVAPYYPQNLYITSAGANGTVLSLTTSIPHNLTVGQEVRFKVPAAFGMVQLDTLVGTVTTIATAITFEVNIDVTTFTAFVFPLAGAVPFTPAQVTPFGEDTGSALIAIPAVDILADATRNILISGIVLAGGVTGPAGSNGDFILWTAGKSVNV